MSVVKEGFVLEVVQRYENDPGMLIPMMQDLQAEYGYLPPEELKTLAAELAVPLSRIYGVAMFYSSFRLSPKGQHEVTLCMGTVCYLKGAPKISEAICSEYQIKPGGTTADRLFTLQAVNCVGACALAPVMVVDGKYYDGVTPDSALKVLRGLAAGAVEAPAPAGDAEVAPQPAAAAAEAVPPEPAAPAAAAAPPPPAAPVGTPAPKPKPAEAKPAAIAKPKAAAKVRPVAKRKPAGKAKPAGRAKIKPAAKTKPTAKAKPKAGKRSRP
jgi:NADH-quinone oxidoreductase subunit E